jgi:hypothetical protein
MHPNLGSPHRGKRTHARTHAHPHAEMRTRAIAATTTRALSTAFRAWLSIANRSRVGDGGGDSLRFSNTSLPPLRGAGAISSPPIGAPVSLPACFQLTYSTTSSWVPFAFFLICHLPVADPRARSPRRFSASGDSQVMSMAGRRRRVSARARDPLRGSRCIFHHRKTRRFLYPFPCCLPSFSSAYRFVSLIAISIVQVENNEILVQWFEFHLVN